ncbi:hypothetical protein SAMN05216271_2311 [Halopseudomonas sabulinigri]|uniref:Uncharacterized protein n=1 Tax=Halopseudomonas sabulinigri TaxID=472181 RepID=A0A1H1TNK0_9GAMM|nr:hypothetical protein SAMN05216271_2311 [Halopseudomonas sabulinigri]
MSGVRLADAAPVAIRRRCGDNGNPITLTQP